MDTIEKKVTVWRIFAFKGYERCSCSLEEQDY